MKARVLGILLLATSISACATDVEEARTGWDRYNLFKEKLQSEQLEFDFQPFFTKWAYQDMHEVEAGERAQVKRGLAYPLYFDTTANHFERSKENGSCLVVNGFTVHGDAVSLSIEFLEEAGALRINDANFLFVESAADFLKEVRCPHTTRAFFGTSPVQAAHGRPFWN